MLEVCIVGAGPCGIAASAACKQRGISHVVLEKSCIVSTIYKFPMQMIFNSTPELLEIGSIPFYTNGAKPTRMEALTYYRTVVDRLELPIHQYEKVIDIKRMPNDEGFEVHAEELAGTPKVYYAKRVVIATGYFDNPNRLGVEGEDLPHVHHYYKDAHPYYGQSVLVVGGTNSAAEAVIDLHRVGAKVTLVHRGEAMSSRIKPWVLPDINSLIQKEAFPVYFKSHVRNIRSDGRVEIQTPEGSTQVIAQHVLALIGYHPDLAFIRSLGVKVDEETGIPVHDPATYETNVPGIYVAGVVVSGFNANRIFIENGRYHGEQIARSVEMNPKTHV